MRATTDLDLAKVTMGSTVFVFFLANLSNISAKRGKYGDNLEYLMNQSRKTGQDLVSRTEGMVIVVA